MFAETIDFLNNIGDTYEILNNVKEKNVNPSELIKAVVNIGNQIIYT